MTTTPGIPRPQTIRLWTRARHAATVKPPLGLAAWSEDADAIAVLLEGTAATLEAMADVADQIPEARDRPGSSAIFVLGASLPAASAWRRLLLRSSSLKISRAPRCTALLARGYVNIGASVDSHSGVDLAWGFAI